MNKILIALSVSLSLLAIVLVVGYSQKANLGGISNALAKFSNVGNGVTTGVLLTTTSAQVLATSSSREYAEITNLTGVTVYCNADGDKPAVRYQGIAIFASSTKVIGQELAYTGAIQCIATANASTTVYARQ